MSLDRQQQLLAEGYERVKVQTVALPHTVWKIDLDLEFDRPLTLAEETVLRLVDAGVSDPAEMGRLMGLEPGVVVPDTVVNLLTRGLLGQVDTLVIMPLGRQALAGQRTRARRTYDDVEVRHDRAGLPRGAPALEQLVVLTKATAKATVKPGPLPGR